MPGPPRPHAPHTLSFNKADAVICSLEKDTPGMDLRKIKYPLLAHAAIITEIIFRESEPRKKILDQKNHKKLKDCEHK